MTAHYFRPSVGGECGAADLSGVGSPSITARESRKCSFVSDVDPHLGIEPTYAALPQYGLNGSTGLNPWASIRRTAFSHSSWSVT